MKKLIFLIILLSIPMVVKAEKNIKDREYRYYYIEKEYSEKFYEKGKNDPLYPKISNHWYYSEEIQTSLIQPNQESLIVEKIPIIKYQEYQKVRYITIDQITSESKPNIMEIEVFVNGTKIQYYPYCDTCSTDFFTKIQNTIVQYEYNYVSQNQKIILDLKDEYFPDDLTLKLYVNGGDGKNINYRVTVNNEKNNLKDTYYQYSVNHPLSFYLLLEQNLKEIEHQERLEVEIKEVRGVDEVKNAKIIEKFTEYHYRNKMYQYYKETKHYIDGYYSKLSGEGIVKDEANFIEREEAINQEPQKLVEYVEREKVVPTTITEYIEKKVPINTYITTPIITEKIEYQDKFIETEVPKEVIVEKSIPVKSQPNYPFQYLVYLASAIFLKKMSFFGS